MSSPAPYPARRALLAVLAVPALAHADAALFDGPITLVPPGRELSDVAVVHDPSSGLAMAWAEDGVGSLRLTDSDGGSPTIFTIDESIPLGVSVQLDGLGGGLVQYRTTEVQGVLGRRILPERAGLGPVFAIVPAELPPLTELGWATLAPNGELLQLGFEYESCIPYPYGGCETSRLVARVRGPDNSDTASGVLLEVTDYAEIEITGAGDEVAVPGGPFLIIYSRKRAIDPDGDIRLIAVARDATLLAGPIQINSYTPGDQFGPRIALTADGGFVATWTSAQSPSPGPADRTILARRFDASGTPVDDDFQVAASIPNNVYRQSGARVTGAPDGSFLVRWTVLDDLGFGQEGQLFDAAGTRIDAALTLVPTGSDGLGNADTVAVGPGRFFTTWRIPGVFQNPPGNDRVEGRTIQRVPWDRIFRARFEGRDLDEWDEVVDGPAL